MAASGVVTQSGDATTLTYTDTSSGIGTVTGRSLVIKNSAGTTLTTINMGSSTTATYAITTDVYLTFIETITLSSGDPLTVTVNYISTQFYKLAQVGLMVASNCICSCGGPTCSTLVKAAQCIIAATTYFNIGDGVNSQLMLTAANTYINNPTY